MHDFFGLRRAGLGSGEASDLAVLALAAVSVGALPKPTIVEGILTRFERCRRS